VSKNMCKINRVLQIAHELGLKTPLVPRLGPWKLEDGSGSAARVIFDKHSLEPGVM
jgi:hypothetical protein